METTFMTIHNITPNANILFASESIVDILGYQPHEVVGKSCFEYFHPDEIPFARHIHNRGIELDKAAMLHYARIKSRNGEWISCECVFTVVHDVLVACTSIYKQDSRSEKRAIDAPAVSRKFSSPPKDPRYHMLQHLSPKFQQAPAANAREPRAALILNRFTRTLTVMFATNAISEVLGLAPDQLTHKSFYECIQENCLPDAIKCLESAKANDSIAYLRFWYRDPRRPEELEQLEREASHSSDEEDGGVRLDGHMDVDPREFSHEQSSGGEDLPMQNGPSSRPRVTTLRTISGDSTDLEQDSSSSIFDKSTRPAVASSSSSSTQQNQNASVQGTAQQARRSFTPNHPLELEAVVSCTSDGLVVILRRATHDIPEIAQRAPEFANGLFAAPWGADVINPVQYQPEAQYAFQPAHLGQLEAAQAHVRSTGGPSLDSFMNSIREVAVFAWSLTGINGNIASYSHGTPRGEAVPPTGFPVWDPRAESTFEPPPNQAFQKWEELHERTTESFQDSQVSYQHRRQELLLRQQYGIGNEYTGSDVPRSAAQQYAGRYIDENRFRGFRLPIPNPTHPGRQYAQYNQYGQNNSSSDNNRGHLNTNPYEGQNQGGGSAPGPVDRHNSVQHEQEGRNEWK